MSLRPRTAAISALIPDPGLFASFLGSDGSLALAAAMLALLVARPRLKNNPVARAAAGDTLTHVPLIARTTYCLVDEQAKVRSITANARRVLGEACDRAAELSLDMRELLQPDDPAELESWLGTAWLPEPPPPLILATRGADAGTRWLELCSPGRVANGSREAVLVEVREVSDRTTRDRELGALAAALEEATDAVYLMDEAGRVQYVNRAFVGLTGYSRDEVIGRPATLLASGRHRAETDLRMWEALRDGRPWAAEMQNRHADGDLYTVDVVVTPVKLAATTQYAAVARDITQRKQLERELEDLAYYDALTGLANHRLLREHSRQILAQARRHGRMAALLHVDVEHLRAVNAQHGRNLGDEVLRTVAERLRQSVREGDALARLGSDEFVVLLSEVADSAAVARVVQRLQESMSQPCIVHGHSITVASHVGIALYPQDATTFDDLLHGAGTALRRAEQAAGTFEFHDRDLSIATHDRISLEDDMHWAWEHDQFVLHYQPIIGVAGDIDAADDLGSGDVIGVEALARWPHLERGMLGPNEFIPLAERTGRILSLDRWAVAAAARQAASWAAHGWNGWIAVNLSSNTLGDPDLPAYVEQVLASHSMGAARLAIEITETSVMRDPAATAQVLEALRAIGVLITIEDFSVGNASLAYLKLFPVDLLKLDAAFIRDLGRDGREEQLVEIMISLAHRTGAKVIAEGVEQQDQLEWLRSAGCDYIQGFLIGRPVPPAATPPEFPYHSPEPQA